MGTLVEDGGQGFVFEQVAPNGRPGGAQRDLLALGGARARLGCSETGPAT